MMEFCNRNSHGYGWHKSQLRNKPDGYVTTRQRRNKSKVRNSNEEIVSNVKDTVMGGQNNPQN